MKRFVCAISITLALAGCSLFDKWLSFEKSGPGYTEPARRSTASCTETLDERYAVMGSGCPDSTMIRLQRSGMASNPILSFFEFSGDGKPYDPSLVTNNLSQLQSVNQGNRRVLQVLFVHGWNHNALQTDSNVQSFKSFLAELQQQEDQTEVGQSRQVVGVYLSWPGQASEGFVTQLLSFRRKKELALDVGGQNSTRALLAELSALRKAHGANRFVLIGHSFGGGFVLKATEQALRDAIMDGKVATAEVFGDAVVLINPAVEAARLVDLHSAIKRDFARCTTVQLASFTSKADSALNGEFPKGMRIFFGDQLNGLDEVATSRKLTPYGLYEPLQQFVLEPTTQAGAASGPLTAADYNAAQPGWASFRNNANAFNLKGLQLRKIRPDAQVGNWSPVLNVLVDPSVIPEHSDIWGPQFSTFIRGMVGMQFSKRGGC